jgi:hypothetical protein
MPRNRSPWKVMPGYSKPNNTQAVVGLNLIKGTARALYPPARCGFTMAIDEITAVYD